MTWRQPAAALVLAAITTASAVAAPAPQELWEEFPLEPPPQTTPAPAPAEPAPVAPFRPPPRALERIPDQAPEGDSDALGVILWIGIGVLGTFVLAAGLRRRGWRPRPAPAGVPSGRERDPVGPSDSEPAAVAMLDGLVGRVRAATGDVAVGAERPVATLPSMPAEAPVETECEIACWPGHGFWQFHVVSGDRVIESLLSPPFGAPGHGAPEQTDAAVRAHEALVEKLIAAGWEPEGRGEAWFAGRFRRVSA